MLGMCALFKWEMWISLGVPPDIISCKIRMWPCFQLRRHQQDLEANSYAEKAAIRCWNQNVAAFQFKEHLWVPILILNARIFVHAMLRLQMCTRQNWEIAENKILTVTSVLHYSTCSILQCTVWRLISYAKPLACSMIKNLNFSMWGSRRDEVKRALS